MNALRKTLHVLAVLAWALWMGGFTFYTAVSLRVAHKVLGDSGEFGFVTQIVTDRLNLIGTVAVVLLLAHLLSHWQVFTSRRRRILMGTWLILAITLAQLYHVHNLIDALLDFELRRVPDRAAFEAVHDRYELIATVQWLCAVIHLAMMLTHERVNSVSNDNRN
ncbi:MAG: hypothetical protein CMO80_17140 [Verrucomicrobiales bacterium]|nr:hypothetical protein [Verrucomicrobiales bacterium]